MMMRESINSQQGTSSNCGFTLVEIMVAIAFFGLVITTLFGSFNSVFTNAEAIDDGIWIYDMGKTCLNRMSDDLQAVYVTLDHTPPGFHADKDDFRLEGETSDIGGSGFAKLRFTSFSHLDFDQLTQEGIAEIVYYVQATEDTGYIIRRADSLPPFQEFEEKASDPILCENVKSLEFKYFDEDGTEHTEWDSEALGFEYATPVAIGIKLLIGEGSESFQFETVVSIPVSRGKKEEES